MRCVPGHPPPAVREARPAPAAAGRDRIRPWFTTSYNTRRRSGLSDNPSRFFAGLSAHSTASASSNNSSSRAVRQAWTSRPRRRVLPCDTGYVARYVTAANGAGGPATAAGVCAGMHAQCSEAGPRLRGLVVSARRQRALPRRHGECRPCPLGRPPGPGMARAGAPGASRCRAAGSQTRRGVRGRG
jgi:hypothetical protein